MTEAHDLPFPPLPDDVVIGLDHQFATEQMVQAYVPVVQVPLAALKDMVYLITHPLELDQVAPARTKALAAAMNNVVDAAFRAAQERNLKDTGKARP